MIDYRLNTLDEMDKARRELFAGYKSLRSLEDRSLRDEKNLNKREIRDLIKKNKKSNEKTYQFLSDCIDKLVESSFKYPEMKNSSHKICENELQKTINIYKEAVNLCNNTDDITHRRDRNYLSNKINKMQDACDLLNMRAKCDNDKLKPLYKYVYEMRCIRADIPEKIDELFKLENRRINGFVQLAGADVNMMIDDKKTKIVEDCIKMARYAQELTFHGMNDPFAKTEEYDLFKDEVQKACEVYKAAQARLAKRVAECEKRPEKAMRDPYFRNADRTLNKGMLNRSIIYSNKSIIYCNELKDKCKTMQERLIVEVKAAEERRGQKNNIKRNKNAPVMTM